MRVKSVRAREIVNTQQESNATQKGADWTPVPFCGIGLDLTVREPLLSSSGDVAVDTTDSNEHNGGRDE